GVKLGINIPLWFKRNRARVESARQMEYGSKEKTEDIENRLEEKIESLSKDLDEINETISLYKTRLIPEVDQMLSSAYAAYETGRISFLDLLDSERMAVNLELEYERVKSKQLIVEANINKTIGILNSEEL
ncbi:MAG: TolC family protein, partial [Fidelibacterota bacterium]